MFYSPKAVNILQDKHNLVYAITDTIWETIQSHLDGLDLKKECIEEKTRGFKNRGKDIVYKADVRVM